MSGKIIDGEGAAKAIWPAVKAVYEEIYKNPQPNFFSGIEPVPLTRWQRFRRFCAELAWRCKVAASVLAHGDLSKYFGDYLP